MTRRVVVTGGGTVGPLGAGVGALIQGVRAGRTVLERAGRTCAARVHEPEGPGPLDPRAARRMDRGSRLAAAAALEALRSSGLDANPAAEIGLVIGTMTAGVESLEAFLTTLYAEGPASVSPMLFPVTVPSAPASQCSILLGLRGPTLTVSQMEASGLAAVATAADLIRGGACDIVLAGGVDERVPEFERAWDGLRLLYRGGPENFPGPFGRRRRGFVPGEGASFVVLESRQAAERRGAALWAEVLGEALTHVPGPAHAWPSDPRDAAAAMEQALSRSGLRTDDLGHVAACANGSRALDAIDAAAIRTALGPAARRVPVTSLKGAVGESGSASACALLVAACSIGQAFVPAIAGLAEPDLDLGLHLVVGEERRGPVPAVLIEAMGTGGSCAAVVLGRPRIQTH
jgi:3-oxoacyl-(acyl-carrier-protein) synthase